MPIPRNTRCSTYTGSLTIGPSGVVAPVGGTGFVFVRYGAFGVYVREAGASLTNQGAITAAYGGHDTSTIQEDGENGSARGIGVVGVYLNGGTVTNFGTISAGNGGGGVYAGSAGDAVHFSATAGTLIVESECPTRAETLRCWDHRPQARRPDVRALCTARDA